MDELITTLNNVLESCQICEAALAAVVVKYEAAIEQGIVDPKLALDLYNENLSPWKLLQQEHIINAVIMELTLALKSDAFIRQVGADVSEEHNTVAPEETVEANTTTPEETMEPNTAEPEETMEHNMATREETVKHNWDLNLTP